MKVMCVGDIHGNIKWFREFFHQIVSVHQPDVLFQVGDFSLSWTNTPIEPFFDQCAELAAQYGTTIYFLDGNHENFDIIYDRYVKDKWDDFTQIREDLLLYVPRGHVWAWGDVKFMAFGGAYTVNQTKYTKFVDYFPQEEPTQDEIDRAKFNGKVDVLLTHEVPKGPKYMDFVYGLDTNPDSDRVRRQLTSVAKSAQPKMIIHGHHHVNYKETWNAQWGEAEVMGLGADYTSMGWGETYYIIDTEYPPWNPPSFVLGA